MHGQGRGAPNTGPITAPHASDQSRNQKSREGQKQRTGRAESVLLRTCAVFALESLQVWRQVLKIRNRVDWRFCVCVCGNGRGRSLPCPTPNRTEKRIACIILTDCGLWAACGWKWLGSLPPAVG
jgi:hypothetical protein